MKRVEGELWHTEQTEQLTTFNSATSEDGGEEMDSA